MYQFTHEALIVMKTINTALLTPVLAIALALLPLTADAKKVYKVIDENGKVIYTDQAPAEGTEAETITLPETNTTPATRAAKPTTQAPTSAAEPTAAAITYKRIEITAPDHQQTIPAGQQTVSVELALTPALAPEHKVQMIFDGSPWGEPAPVTRFVLENLERGEHQLQVEIIDSEGKRLGRSNTVTIYVQRPSVLSSKLQLPETNSGSNVQRAGAASGAPQSPFSMTVAAQQARNNSK